MLNSSSLNRDQFSTQIGKALARSKRHPSQRFALLQIQGGRESQEEKSLLVESLEGNLRQEDVITESTDGMVYILVGELRHWSDPLRIARRLLSSCSIPFRVGIATSQGQAEKSEQLLFEAHAALKRTRGDVLVAYFDSAQQNEAEARLDFEEALKKAIQGGSLQPFYQPIVDLQDGRINGFEALVRWSHPTQGWLLPHQFLQVAKDCGVLVAIDLFVLDRALEQLGIWREQVDYPIRVNVNLSPEHFTKPEGVDLLRPILKRHAHLLGSLRIDICENVLTSATGLESLNELRDLKIGFHMDDFGAGAESFQALSYFPFESLKIDRSMVSDMEEEVNAELIIAILRIAQRLKLRTIAEGLATHAQLEELRSLGCNEAQGFLFSPAVDAKSALALLIEGRYW